MNVEAQDLWGRATEALRLAKHDMPISADGAASWAYYAAFHAVSALFAMEGRTFGKHAEVEATVHRDLVKTGRWPVLLGRAFSRLNDLRDVGHYGGSKHVTGAEAENAIAMAEKILRAVAALHPEVFGLDEP
jgi:uncharacterized protein (UPF0332 family)